MNILDIGKIIYTFTTNPKVYIKKIIILHRNFFYLLHKLDKPAIIILVSIIWFFLLIILPPSRMVIIGKQQDNLQREKAYVDTEIHPLLSPQSVLLVADLDCIKDVECTITLFGNKKDLTLEENQTTGASKRSPVTISLAKNPAGYEFLYKLFNFLSPSDVCQPSDIKNTFNCRRNHLYSKADDNSSPSGYSKDLHDLIFGFEKTKDLQSIAFHVAKPLDKLTAHYRRSVLIMLNHNELVNLKNSELERKLHNRITHDKDSEAADYINSKQIIFSMDTIRYKITELIAKYHVLLNVIYPVNRY